jgi:hypothetical protein
MLPVKATAIWKKKTDVICYMLCENVKHAVISNKNMLRTERKIQKKYQDQNKPYSQANVA